MNHIKLIPTFQRKKTIPKQLKDLELFPLKEQFSKLTMPIIGDDYMRPVMMGNFFDMESKKIVSTDAHKLTAINMPNETFNFIKQTYKKELNENPKGLIFHTLSQLKSDYNELVKIGVNENTGLQPFDEYVKFREIEDGRYPDYEAIIPRDFTNIINVDYQKLYWYAKVLIDAKVIDDATKLNSSNQNEYQNKKIDDLKDSYVSFLMPITDSESKKIVSKEIILTYFLDDGTIQYIAFNAIFLCQILKFAMEFNGKYFGKIGISGNSRGILIEFENGFLLSNSFGILMPISLKDNNTIGDESYGNNVRMYYDLDTNSINSDGRNYPIDETIGYVPSKDSLINPIIRVEEKVTTEVTSDNTYIDDINIDDKILIVEEKGKPLSTYKNGDKVFWANYDKNWKLYVEGEVFIKDDTYSIKRFPQNPNFKKYPFADFNSNTKVVLKPNNEPIYFDKTIKNNEVKNTQNDSASLIDSRIKGLRIALKVAKAENKAKIEKRIKGLEIAQKMQPKQMNKGGSKLGDEIKDVSYIWRTTPSLVKIIKIKKTAKGGYSGLFSYPDEDRTKWERLDKYTGYNIWNENTMQQRTNKIENQKTNNTIKIEDLLQQDRDIQNEIDEEKRKPTNEQSELKRLALEREVILRKIDKMEQFKRGGGVDGIDWYKYDGQYEAEFGNFYLYVIPSNERGRYYVRVTDGYRGDIISQSTEEILGLDNAKEFAIDIVGDYMKGFNKGGRIKEGDKFGNYSITKYSPITYDDLGSSNNGLVKLVNQEDFDTILIQYDNALRGGKWFVSKNGILYEGKNPNEVIDKLNLNKMSKGGVVFTNYNGSEIMYEPNYDEYFVNDEVFDSMEDAKNYIDTGEMENEKYGFGGGLLVGSLVGGYLGYKVGKYNKQVVSSGFQTEKLIGKDIKNKLQGKKTYADGGAVGSEIEFNRYGEQRTGTIYEDFGDDTYGVQSGTRKVLVQKGDITKTLEPQTKRKFRFFKDGGGIYSSDELYILKVFDLNGNLLDSSKRVWARNLSKAKEIAIDDFEYDMQQKYGKDLRFRVEVAPSMFVGGGGVDGDIKINDNITIKGNKVMVNGTNGFVNSGTINEWFEDSSKVVKEVLNEKDDEGEIIFTKIAESDNFIYYIVKNGYNPDTNLMEDLLINPNWKLINVYNNYPLIEYYVVHKPTGRGGMWEILNGWGFMPLQDEFKYGKLNYQHPSLKRLMKQDSYYKNKEKYDNGGGVDTISDEDLLRIKLAVAEAQDRINANQNESESGGIDGITKFIKENPQVLLMLEKGGSVGDENYEMLKNKVTELLHHSKELQAVVKKKPKTPAWVISKSSRASTDLSDITHYLEGKL